jgi:N-acetylmuramic acid 6-phosphate etherase
MQISLDNWYWFGIIRGNRRGFAMTTSTESRHPDAQGLQDRPAEAVLARLLAGQRAATGAVEAAIPAIAKAAEAAAEAVAGGGKLAYAGAGSSGLMALADALELHGTFGILVDRTPVLFAGGAAALLAMTGAVEDVAEHGARDVRAAGLGAGDVMIAVSASGTTPYTLAAVEAARARGVKVVGIANVAGSRLLELSYVPVLLDTGAELVAGSTRMGAGTAAKIALNMLSTLMGLKLGHVHDGFMVNVVADNAKLKARAARIVAAISGADAEVSAAALEACGGAVKPAVLVAAGAADRAEAEARLAESNGQLGPALKALGEKV